MKDGSLGRLDYPVNALASTANQIHHKTRLEALYEIAAYLLSASTEAVKNNPDKSSGDPWRVLVMNYGIIASRSHNSDLMDSAFKTLLHYFPESAPGFFNQGMSEMVRLNYLLTSESLWKDISNNMNKRLLDNLDNCTYYFLSKVSLYKIFEI